MEEHLAHSEDFYISYINCLNGHDFNKPDVFIHHRLTYNTEEMCLADYIRMLEDNLKAIPNLYDHIDLLVTSNDRIAAQINFQCSLIGDFMGVQVNEKQVHFAEHVFYLLTDRKIAEVTSLIDLEAIRKQRSAAGE